MRSSRSREPSGKIGVPINQIRSIAQASPPVSRGVPEGRFGDARMALQ
jgi:hypothetical protein